MPALVLPQHSNQSVYTLDTVADDERASLIGHSDTSTYGTTEQPQTSTRPSSKKLIFHATLKMAAIFIVSTLLLGGTLWLALPTLEECVRVLCQPQFRLTASN
jgi:hypothetical protein